MNRPLSLVLASVVAILGGAGSAAAWQEPAPSGEKPKEAAPGLRLTYQEMSRGPKGGMDVVTCVLKAEGFPRDKSYRLAGKRMDGSISEVTSEIRIDESGRLVGPDGEELKLDLGAMFAGEYVVFALVSEDKSAKAIVEITPHPIEAEGKGGCRLGVRPLDPKGQAFAITGSGFKPDKKLKTVSSSSNEIVHGSMKGRPDGSVKMAIFPAVVGQTGGDASFTASDSACSVTVKYKWGDRTRDLPPTAEKAAP